MNREEKKTCNLDLSFEFDDRKQNDSIRENNNRLYLLEEQNDAEKVQFDISFEFPEAEPLMLFAEKETLPSTKGKRK